MNKETINRLKALEAASSTGPMMLLVEDVQGNRFECSLHEYLTHDNEVEHTDPNGKPHTSREWEFIRCVSGATVKGAVQVLGSIPSAI